MGDDNTLAGNSQHQPKSTAAVTVLQYLQSGSDHLAPHSVGKPNPFGDAKPRELSDKRDPEFERSLSKKFEAMDLERQAAREQLQQQAHHQQYPTHYPLPQQQHQLPQQYDNLESNYNHQGYRGRGGGGGPRGRYNSNYNNRDQQHEMQHAPPPEGYICKLCYVPGHWMKQCALFKAYDNTNMNSYQQSYNHNQQRGYTNNRNQGYSNMDYQSNHMGRGGGGSSAAFANRHQYNLQQSHHQQPDPNAMPPNNYVCHKCNQPGHWIQYCPSQEKRAPPAGYICRICNVEGHYIRDCPNKSVPEQT